MKLTYKSKNMATLRKKIIIILGFLFLTILSFSQTIISNSNSNNVITGGTTYWTDPWYIVQDPVSITSSGTLEISAGTLIEIDPGCSFDVQGSMIAVGNSNNFITFTARYTYVGWSGINIYNNYTNEFDYCFIEYVIKNPVTCSNNSSSIGAVYLNNSDATTFNYCIFRNNEVCSGGGIAAISSKLLVSNCTFHNNTVIEKGGGIYAENTSQSSYIEDCNLNSNIAEYGGGIYLEYCVNETKVDNNLIQ
jgi:predicted outer membrane repeat protein